jgi:type I restriction enzyme S subunit
MVMQQNTELPEGWVKTYLEQVCFFVGGKTPSNINNLHSSGQIPFYKVSDMNHPDNKKYMINANLCFDEDFIKENRLNLQPEGTVIFPKRGGAIHTNKKEFYRNPHSMILILWVLSQS